MSKLPRSGDTSTLSRSAIRWLAVGCLTLSAAACEGTAPDLSGHTLVANATVVEVIDGDTIRVDVATGVETVRLLGIDTPETVDPNRPAQCFGAEASAYLSALLPIGTPVLLTRDQQARDAFGRLLAYVFVANDGMFANLELLRGGFADTLSIEPNTTYRSAFSQALHAAKQNRSGLWATCDGPDQPVSDQRAN